MRGECVTTMITQISINVIKKYLRECDHSLSGFMCQRGASERNLVDKSKVITFVCPRSAAIYKGVAPQNNIIICKKQFQIMQVFKLDDKRLLFFFFVFFGKY